MIRPLFVYLFVFLMLYLQELFATLDAEKSQLGSCILLFLFLIL